MGRQFNSCYGFDWIMFYVAYLMNNNEIVLLIASLSLSQMLLFTGCYLHCCAACLGFWYIQHSRIYIWCFCYGFGWNLLCPYCLYLKKIWNRLSILSLSQKLFGLIFSLFLSLRLHVCVEYYIFFCAFFLLWMFLCVCVCCHVLF